MSNDNSIDLEDQARLNLTLRTREAIIKDLTEGGKMPTDNSGRSFLISALDGMDRTVLSKSKIKAEDANNKTNAQMAGRMAELLLRVRTSQAQAIRSELPALPSSITTGPLVEGETDIGLHDLNFKSFMEANPD